MPKMTLEAARRNAKLTQMEAAEKLGVAVTTLRNWEKGTTFPKQPSIEKMCELYGVPYDFISFV